MPIYLPERSSYPQRIRGMCVSVLLHAAAIALLIAFSTSADLVPAGLEAGPVITYVTSRESAPSDEKDARPSPGDRRLIEERDADEPDDNVSAGDGFSYNLAKIRSRQQSLFPFLTLDLMFLGRVTEAVTAPPKKLVNPFATAVETAASESPLSLSDAAMQQTIDRAWSRRERWRAFQEIATLASTHDPNDGQLPWLLRGYLDQNLLQPFCDGDRRDPRFWAMLENAADHVDFIDFVRSFAREHPSSKATTELLFLLDEIAQGSRDVLVMLLDTRPDEDLLYTREHRRDAYRMAVGIREHFDEWLFDREIHTVREVKERYDAVRLRLLSTIIETTPNGYREADARFLAGEIAFNQGNLPEALRYWRGMTAVAGDAYEHAYSEVLAELQSPRALDVKQISRILQGAYGRWRVYSIDRLRQFGYRCSTF